MSSDRRTRLAQSATDVAAANGGGDSGYELDWSALMTQAQGGDAAAYRTLLEAIAPYLRALAARRHRDARDIEDAVQDILLTVHAIRHTYDPARPFGPWLVAIANRRLVDRLRRQGRTSARETALEPAHENRPAFGHETFAAPEANLYGGEAGARRAAGCPGGPAAPPARGHHAAEAAGAEPQGSVGGERALHRRAESIGASRHEEFEEAVAGPERRDVNTTPQLIDSLVRDLAPVRRLRRPALRSALWLGLAALVIALAAIVHGLRPDLAAQVAQADFLAPFGLALATGILAALAAFMASLPDRSRWWLLLPVPTLLLWLATLGQQCLTDWVATTPDGGTMPGITAKCFATLVLTGLPLQIGLMAMLRHAARLRPYLVTIVGGLAVAALTAAALRWMNEPDATLLVLVWNLAVAGAIVALLRHVGPKPAPAATRPV